MKLIVVLALVACAAAQGIDESQAEIISANFIQDELGGYKSDIETSNSIQQRASGESIPGPEPETGSYRMEGEYSYESPEGEIVTVKWYADETGYHAESDSLPIGPVPQF